MARPSKIGLDYYPMDVGFLRDKKVKLLRSEFGASGVLFVLYVFGKAYEGDGYFLTWDKDELLLAADELCETPTFINEVLKGCLRRSLFDERVFQAFGVLTSVGIQRRYIRGCEKRDGISIFNEYWLLDVSSKKDVPAGIRAKLAFASVSGERNEVISPGNPVKSPGNPQSKVKESRVKESRKTPPAQASLFATQLAESGFGEALRETIEKWAQYRSEIRKPLTETGCQTLVKTIREYSNQYGEAAIVKLIEETMSSGLQGIYFEKLERRSVSKGPSVSVGEVDWMRDIIKQRGGT